MTHISIGDYDPFDSRVIANPYPYYELLRREAPVHRLERYGFYVVTRYADVEAVLNDHETFSSAWGPGPAKVIQPIRNILNSDPPEHTALRSIMADAFAPETLQRIEPRVAALCESLTERLAQTGRADLVSDFAVPLPMDVIAQLLGVPVEDRNSFKSCSDDIVAEIGTRRSATLARRAFSDYLRPLIAERKARPRDDLITRLLQPAGSEPLSDQEVIAFCQALLVAGNENVSGLIGNLFLALARRPDEWKRLRDDPGRVPAAVEESLRFDSPNQGLFRHTTRDVEMHGVTISADTKLLVSFGSANRDPDRFSDPERFDVAREPNPHLAFGAGIHRCLGAPLARLQAQLALRTALRRFREIRLLEADPPYAPVFFQRCPERLAVELVPSPS
jgi:cytochrome P450